MHRLLATTILVLRPCRIDQAATIGFHAQFLARISYGVACAMQRPKGHPYALVTEYTAADGSMAAGPAAAAVPPKSETIAATLSNATQT